MSPDTSKMVVLSSSLLEICTVALLYALTNSHLALAREHT